MARRGLLLDFGGVITTDVQRSLRGYCERMGLPADALATALATPAGRRARAAVESGTLDQCGYEDTLGQLLGVGGHGLLRRLLADLRPRPGIDDLLRRARAAGVATAVVSNSLGAGEFDPYRGYDLDRRVDAVVLSHRVGVRKPDPAIYRLAVAAIGVPARQCVFVDDSPANLAPARELGMTAVLAGDAGGGVSDIESLLGIGRRYTRN